MTTKTTVDDTVHAQVAPVNLYDLVYPVKEQQLADYGRVWDHNYEQKMLALLEGKPQQRLQNDRVAREVVRAILTAKDSLFGCGSWVRLEGKDPEYFRTSGATTFPNIPNKDIRHRLYALMNEDGLLDVMFGACGDIGSWCFESEIIYYQEKNVPDHFTGKPVTHSCARYMANNKLREAVTAMLKPFEAEKPMYVHPERRF